MNGFHWYPDETDPTKWYCQSPSGEVYELRTMCGKFVSCSCPDAMIGRSHRAGKPCKHRIAAAQHTLDLALALGCTVPDPAKAARIMRLAKEVWGS